MELTPTILIHMTAAIGAVVTGPVALWARKGATQRPAVHRVFGYTWVVLMLVTAISALFIRDFRAPNIAGYTAIHLLVPVTLGALFFSFRALFVKRNIAQHRGIMQRLYFGACVVAGLFTLAPNRIIGKALGTANLMPIVSNTPVWVWGLLAALLAIGYTQTKNRNVGALRVAIMPVAMTAFSLYGMVGTFGHASTFSSVVFTWALLAVTTFSLVAAGRANGTYDAAARTFALPGSWAPMALILGIFTVRYASGVSLALHPQLVNDAVFSLGMAAVGGVISGMFIGRAVRVLKLAVAGVRFAYRQPT